ncbi:hypothetical protein [Streptomyces sp. NPDC058374]|uniref:hypothetical protein n=1 Tax=Streptomyces sp. NPDC058374 TaxID=3346466 RepID=UPI0036514DFB
MYSTSWWVAEPPSTRPATDEVTLAPNPPIPPKSSSKWPDQYGSAKKQSHPTAITARSSGSPRRAQRPTTTSTATTPSITNGVSWWEGTAATKSASTTQSSTVRRPGVVGATAASPGSTPAGGAPVGRNHISSTAAKARYSRYVKLCGEK